MLCAVCFMFHESVFSGNLICAKIYLMKNYKNKNLLSFIAVFVLVSGVFVFGTGNNIVLAKDCSDLEGDEKEECEDSKDEIDDLEDEKEEEMEKLQRYEGDVSRLQGAVYSTQADINKTEEKIETVEETIKRKEKEIKDFNKNIEFKRVALERMLQEIYISSEQPLLYLFMKRNYFVDSAVSKDNLSTLKKKILSMIEEINQTKIKIKKEQEELEDKKGEHEELLSVKQFQKSNLLTEKQVFEKKLKDKKLTVAEINAKISKVKSALSSFLGESFDADDIVEAIEFASDETGVREEFLMAMLDKETDLGRFTGGCTYKNTRIRDKNPDDESIFKDICEELDYNYKKKKVSCALSYGYGGAMGVAQFMPSTWIGYKNRISSYTGHDPADPWNLTDGVVGMAIKLKDAGGDKEKGEYKASAIYYCGGNWNRTVCHNYASTVKSWSEGYDEYF